MPTDNPTPSRAESIHTDNIAILETYAAKGMPMSGPCAWAAKRIRSLETRIMELEKINRQSAEDWVEDKEHLKTLAKKYFSDAQVEGDSNFVPSIQDLVSMLDTRLAECEKVREAASINERVAQIQAHP